MTLPNDAQERAKKRAKDLQHSLDSMVNDERDTESLLEKLDKLIADLVDLAQDWESVDADMADRVRKQEQEVHELRARVERLGELGAAESTKIVDSIRRQLKLARGEH